MAKATRRREPDDEDDDLPPRRTKRKLSSKKSNTGLYIGLAVGGAFLLFLVCGGGGAAAWFLASSRTKNAEANNQLRVPVDQNPDWGAKGLGKIEINPTIKQETGTWQRLTPADHMVIVLAPGTPEAITDDFKLPKLELRSASSGWEARGTANSYFFFDMARPKESKGEGPDLAQLPTMMLPYLGLGGFAEPTTKVTVNGQPGQQFEPVKGFGISGVFVYRVVAVGDRIYIFGANTRADDPAVQKFFDSVKFPGPPKK